MKNFFYYNPNFEYEEIFSDWDWPWAGHKFFIYDFIRNLKPKVIVELGTHKGTSFFSMCQAVKDGKLKTKLYAIDTWKGDKHTGFYDESIFKEVNFIKNKYYPKQNIYFIRKFFDEAVFGFKNNSIDLLHIDGLHTYKAVKHDFETWFNKVKKDGIILFHDTHEKKDDFGVYKLWEKLKNKFKSVDFFHSHGLGVLFKNKTIYQEIFKFNFPQIWPYYYFLKYLEKTNNEIKNLEKLSSLQSKISDLQNQIKNQQSHIQSLETQLNTIKSAKFFRLWQSYCRIRDKILEKINENKK